MDASKVWKPVLDNHYLVSRDLVPREAFLDILCRKGVLQKEEKQWLLKNSLGDDNCRLTNLVLLYPILRRHPDAISTYQVLGHALLSTKQIDVLEALLRIEPCKDDKNVLRHIVWDPVSFASFSRASPTIIVHVIVDEELLVKVQKYETSTRTWLCQQLFTRSNSDEVKSAFHLHVVGVSDEQETRNLTVIYPHMETQLKEGNCTQVTRKLVRLQDILPSDESHQCQKCDVELISVWGLSYLFESISDFSPRSEFLSSSFGKLSVSSTSQAVRSESRDGGTQYVYNPQNLEKMEPLANGTFSSVFKIRIINEDIIAVLKVVNSNLVCHNPFHNELKAIQDTGSHINVVSLLGISILKPRVEEALVFEYAENRDLDHFLTHHLEGHPAVPELGKRLFMALDIAQGMEYVHKTVYHLDLKTSSVLVARDYQCKISDFGSCELPGELPRDSSNSTFWVTSCANLESNAAFVAPERYQDNTHWTEKKRKADVFAYSMILCHLKDLRKPWKDESGDVIKKKVVENGRPMLENVSGCPQHITKIIQSCWRHRPEERPDFFEIVKQLTTSAQPTASGSVVNPPARTSHSFLSSGLAAGQKHAELPQLKKHTSKRENPVIPVGTSSEQQQAFPTFERFAAPSSEVYTKTTDGLSHPNQQTSDPLPAVGVVPSRTSTQASSATRPQFEALIDKYGIEEVTRVIKSNVSGSNLEIGLGLGLKADQINQLTNPHAIGSAKLQAIISEVEKSDGKRQTLIRVLLVCGDLKLLGGILDDFPDRLVI
ncbi:mitogen-activated protein kinase kinase kinase 7-like isoform X2 [Corticium candelabrum]|uniref:mitogen-activated protein kinase kinase kinase 7-like isoform X2 n=1 Tax=Corticium candelabrum TaxID=121492 RepID=UPI002E253EA7|nr:mitogen-activated protein kinase kinase kinase 7-like isoform X2 [Corticium candelabrum]